MGMGMGNIGVFSAHGNIGSLCCVRSNGDNNISFNNGTTCDAAFRQNSSTICSNFVGAIVMQSALDSYSNKPAIIESNFALGTATWPTRRNIRVIFDSDPLAPLCEYMT